MKIKIPKLSRNPVIQQSVYWASTVLMAALFIHLGMEVSAGRPMEDAMPRLSLLAFFFFFAEFFIWAFCTMWQVDQPKQNVWIKKYAWRPMRVEGYIIWFQEYWWQHRVGRSVDTEFTRDVDVIKKTLTNQS